MNHTNSSNNTEKLHIIENKSISIELDNKSSLEIINLDYLMKLFNVPGLSLAIIDNFKIVATKGYGFIERGSNIPITNTTLFQAGSISKPVAAIGALQLVEKGLLSLDENVNLKLISWKLPDSKFTEQEKVTLRRLLSHTAGLTVHGFPGYELGQEIPSLIQVLDGKKPANTPPVRNNFIPGSKWSYSGGGYLIIQQMMIDSLGKSFPELMKSLVFSKIGMVNSTYEQPLPLEFRSRDAHGSNVTGEVVKGNWHIYPEMAAGGLWTTPTDLAAFAIEIALSKHGKSNKLISKEMTNEMLSSQIDLVTEYSYGNVEHPDNVGLGFFLGDDTRPDLFGHIGDDEGFQAMMIMNSDSGKGAVIMSNSQFGFQIGDFLIDGIAEEYKWENYHRSSRVWIGFIALLYEIMDKKGINYVIKHYKDIIPRFENFYKTDKDSLILFAYFLVTKGKIQEAIETMKFQILNYPNFWNSYDSIGEMYMFHGDHQLAISNFQKSIELNPDNASGIMNLEKLRKLTL